MKTINLSRGLVTIVDDDDYDYLMQWNWHASASSGGVFYAKANTTIEGVRKQIIMSRVIMKTPPSLECDHINHDTLDNRKSNLRNCSRLENRRNGKARKASTKYLGVYRRKENGKFITTISINGRSKEIGRFHHDWAAALAYDLAAYKYYGEFANLNFGHLWKDHQSLSKIKAQRDELLRQRDELREALAEQKRLYFNLFDEETSCMYCEAKIRRGSAIILCKECAENTEV